MKKFFVTFILLLSLSTVAHAKMKGKIIDCTYIAPKQSFAINIPAAFGKRVIHDGKKGNQRFMQVSDDSNTIRIEVDPIPVELEYLKTDLAVLEQVTDDYIESLANQYVASKPSTYKKEIISFEDGSRAFYYEFIIANGVTIQKNASKTFEDLKNSVLFKVIGNELISINFQNIMMHSAEKLVKDYDYTDLAKTKLVEYINSFTHDIASMPKPKK